MSSLYESYLAFRATLNIPELRTPLTTVPNVRKNRTTKWKGSRKVKMEGKP